MAKVVIEQKNAAIFRVFGAKRVAGSLGKFVGPKIGFVVEFVRALSAANFERSAKLSRASGF